MYVEEAQFYNFLEFAIKINKLENKFCFFEPLKPTLLIDNVQFSTLLFMLIFRRLQVTENMFLMRVHKNTLKTNTYL